MLKLAQTNQPTNQQTNQQPGQKQYFAHLRGTNLFTKFHDDWAKNVTSRVHVIQLTGTIFKLNSHIKETNVLNKFHEQASTLTVILARTTSSIKLGVLAAKGNAEDDNAEDDYDKDDDADDIDEIHDIKKDSLLKVGFPPVSRPDENWAKNITSRVFTCFHYIHTYINKTNVLSNFHDDWAKIVTSRVVTKKTAPPRPGSHVIQLTGTIFELNSHIKKTNVLTKFHENWAKNVTSRVFTYFHYIHREKCPTHWRPCLSTICTIFELVRDINKNNFGAVVSLNVSTNFHDDWAKIVTSRVFTRKTAPPTGRHVFQRTGTTFKLNQHIIKTNILTKFQLDRDFIKAKLLTKFDDDRTINVDSRVFTNKCGRTDDRQTDDGQRPVTKAHLSSQVSSKYT
ncbi:hypothetical protein DPMN_019030 [Dreissena polymorpha]|uniref:Uncharacterized protein n=1 Tax=Dreissena polymorpha TaxID=45954 RepID=A0A9D4S7U0_DREPO|nr:hypothetical protein DPMN_019030 [Dreissena polymorpha]